MSATRHTPGPWAVSERDANGRTLNGWRCVVVSGTPVAFALADCGAAGNALASANAKLIAAAPALADEAEKLTALVAHIVEYAHYESDDDTPCDVLKRIWNEAREVAKSVGYDGDTTAALRAAGRLP